MKTTTPDTFISPADLLERLDWRYAVKQFDPALRIDEPTWNALEESLRLSPSSGGPVPQQSCSRFVSWNFSAWPAGSRNTACVPTPVLTP